MHERERGTEETVEDGEEEEDREKERGVWMSFMHPWVMVGGLSKRSRKCEIYCVSVHPCVCVLKCVCSREVGTWKEYPKKKIVPASLHLSSLLFISIYHFLVSLQLQAGLLTSVCVHRSQAHTLVHTCAMGIQFVCVSKWLTNCILRFVFAKWLTAQREQCIYSVCVCVYLSVLCSLWCVSRTEYTN